MVSRLQVVTREKQLALAKLTLAKHEFISPIGGVITKRHVQVGSWVREGDAVLTVIHLETLRAEGFVSLKQRERLRIGQRVPLTINQPADQLRSDRLGSGQSEPGQSGSGVSREGRITFIHPVVDAVSQEIRIWIDFPNTDDNVRPGMRANVVAILNGSSGDRGVSGGSSEP